MVDSYYEVLQVGRGAAPEVIRAAYRALMREAHPDHASGDGQSAARLNEAYEVLSDPARRKEHDRSLDADDVSSTSAGGDEWDGRPSDEADREAEVPVGHDGPQQGATPPMPDAVTNPFPWEAGGHDGEAGRAEASTALPSRRRPRVVVAAGAAWLALGAVVVVAAALQDASVVARTWGVAFYLGLLGIAWLAWRRRAKGHSVGPGYVIYLSVLGLGLVATAGLVFVDPSPAAWVSLAYSGAWTVAYVVLVESTCRWRRRQMQSGLPFL